MQLAPSQTLQNRDERGNLHGFIGSKHGTIIPKLLFQLGITLPVNNHENLSMKV